MNAYGRSPKPGRPPANTEAERATPRCEKCRNLHIGQRGGVSCPLNPRLEATGCAHFDTIAVQRATFFGGISGVGMAR